MFSVKTNLCTYFFHQILALSRLEGKRFTRHMVKLQAPNDLSAQWVLKGVRLYPIIKDGLVLSSELMM